jgi:uncharacterized protein YjbI with pentapeptide repeats
MTAPTGKQHGGPVIIALALILVVGCALHNWQQSNINSLETKIKGITTEIDNETTGFSDRDKTRLHKDILVIEKDKTAIQNGAYTNIIQAIGGIVVGITAYVGYMNFQATLDKQAQDREIANQNLQAIQDKQLTERYSQAIENLGSDNANIRCGGINMLEQIAIDSPLKYHWRMVENLSAFIRVKCTDATQTGTPATEDIKQALLVIGRRNTNYDEKFIDLKKVNLKKIDLQGLNFKGANLHNANFSRAELSDINLSNADLGGAHFLDGTILIRAILEKADLSGADLSGAQMVKTNLSKADLQGATLDGTILNGAILEKADLSGAHLTQINLSKCKNLTAINFKGAYLTKVNLSKCILTNVDFSGAIFSEVDLRGADLLECQPLTDEQLNSIIHDRDTKLPESRNSLPANS